MGTIKSAPVVNTREWHFFPTGRVLVRFTNHRAGLFYPQTIEDVSDNWGAYRVGPKPAQRDILHRYADDSLFLETDQGEQIEMTLEDGRRHLFWEKDYQIWSEWAAEQKPIPCQLPDNANASLINTGLPLKTSIAPDNLGDAEPWRIQLAGPSGGNFTVSGTMAAAGTIVLEQTADLTPPVAWQAIQTNSVPAGAFQFQAPQGASAVAFFRVRTQ
jgi:hypothetical protein